MTKPNQEQWTLIIEPPTRLFDLRLREFWQYRDLVFLFVHRDFVAQYKQTILGPVWHFIQPLFTTIVFTVIFGNIAHISTEGTPPFLFYMAGTVIWGYFSAVLTNTSSTFTGNAGIFGKVYFPRLVIPVANLISRLIAFAIQFFFFLCFLLFFALSGADIHLTPWVFATPMLLIMMAALGLGLGVIVSSLTTKYRDLTVLVGFGVQLLMYASPIIYPLSAIPEKYQILFLLNPITPVVELFRHAFLGVGAVNVEMLIYSVLFVSAILYFGIIMFNRVERTFMDTV